MKTFHSLSKFSFKLDWFFLFLIVDFFKYPCWLISVEGFVNWIRSVNISQFKKELPVISVFGGENILLRFQLLLQLITIQSRDFRNITCSIEDRLHFLFLQISICLKICPNHWLRFLDWDYIFLELMLCFKDLERFHFLPSFKIHTISFVTIRELDIFIVLIANAQFTSLPCF